MDINALKLSRYNLFTDDLQAVSNVRSGAAMTLDPDTFRLLKSGRFLSLPAVRIRELAAGGFLVPADPDEISLVLSGRRRRNHVFRILTTTACNASCRYCYQKSHPPSFMDAAAAAQTARFIAGRAESWDRPAQLEWFGGEPLLNTEAIDIICRTLSGAGVHFHSAVTTNAAALTEELADKALTLWKLIHAQITLDGAGRRHEAVKGLPPGTFDRIIVMIHQLTDRGISICVRVNHTDSAAEAELISLLAREFADARGLLRVRLSPLYQAAGRQRLQAMAEILALRRLLAESGLEPPRRCFGVKPISSRCASAEGGYTIAPDGLLYTCAHCMEKSQCFGSVWECDEDHPARRLFISRDLPEKCLQCLYLPVCLGGCRAAELGLAALEQCSPASLLFEQAQRMRIILQNSRPRGREKARPEPGERIV